MPVVDATAQATLESAYVRPVYFGYFDFVGAPARATTYKEDVTLSGTGDSELDGTYEAFDPRVIQVGDISNQKSGSEPLDVRMSGIASIDTALFNIIHDRSKWYRRVGRIWLRVHNEAGTQQGAIVAAYTGFMIDARIVPTAESQEIVIKLENFINLLREAAGRTWLDQKLFDSGDESAAASIGGSLGVNRGPAGTLGGGRGGGGNVSELFNYTNPTIRSFE